MCQAKRKALMSNPNKKLGNWILRRVLNLNPRQLVSMNDLLEKNIDSLVIEKESDQKFFIKAHRSIESIA